MYRLEIIDHKEKLLLLKKYNDKQNMLIDYKRIINNLNNRNNFKNNIIMLFEGLDQEHLREIIKYRIKL